MACRVAPLKHLDQLTVSGKFLTYLLMTVFPSDLVQLRDGSPAVWPPNPV